LKNNLILINSVNAIDIHAHNILIDLSCYTFINRNTLDKYNISIGIPFSNTESERDNDIIKASELKNELFDLLINELNEFHKLNWSKRNWQIVIGHWLERYISIFISRFNKLNTIFKYNTIDSIQIFKIDAKKITIVNSCDIVTLSNSDIFNSFFYHLIIKHYFPEYLNKINFINLCENQFRINENKIEKLNNLKNYLIKIYNIITVSKNKKHLFYNTYLTKFKFFKLNLVFHQLPVILPKSFFFELNIDINFNKNHFIDKDDLGFLYSNISYFFPKIFLNPFPNLLELIHFFGIPKEPKTILTANSFDHNDIFKIYVSHKINEKTEYHVLQHGAQYGVNKYYINRIEEITADKFLTWGWKHNPNHYPTGIILKKLPSYTKKLQTKEILFVQKCLDHRINTYDEYYIFETYILKQKKLLENLNQNLKSLVRIRIMYGEKNKDGFEHERWENYKIDDGKLMFRNIFYKYKLLVFTYDSTAFYEVLNTDIPSILVFCEDYYLLNCVSNDFNALYDVGIFYRNVAEAAKFINENNDHLLEWWNSTKVKNTRIEFSKLYSFSNKKLINNIKHTINE